MDDAKHLPTIVESYKDYRPPFNARQVVERLFDDVQQKYLSGLNSVVLTNSGALNRSRRRSKTKSRGQRVSIPKTLGLYHQKRYGAPIWIELFVDNITRRWPRPLLWMRVFQDMTIGSVFYHELGHHVHFTKLPEHKEREDVADEWAWRFYAAHLRKRHRITYAIIWLLRNTIGPAIARYARRRLAPIRNKGRRSRDGR